MTPGCSPSASSRCIVAEHHDRLLAGPLPIDGNAARVIKPARPEHVWQPQPRPVSTAVESPNFLPTAPLPPSAPRWLLQLIGQRRGALVVVGYSARQGSKSKGSKWVVRCDCGRYEHRTSIVRWLGTKAPDWCRECVHRRHRLTQGQAPSLPKAERVDLRPPQAIQPVRKPCA